jgi:hypothetical protein
MCGKRARLRVARKVFIMARREFEVVAWSNGGTGYGLKMSALDRDAYLKREWGEVDLYLPGRDRPTKVNIDKDSLWNKSCRELISKEIGSWLIDNGTAPWPKGSPPKFKLVWRAPREFDVIST